PLLFSSWLFTLEIDHAANVFVFNPVIDSTVTLKAKMNKLIINNLLLHFCKNTISTLLSKIILSFFYRSYSKLISYLCFSKLNTKLFTLKKFQTNTDMTY